MSGFTTSVNNLTWTVTNGAMNSAIGNLFGTLHRNIANGGRDKNLKFHWDNGDSTLLKYATRQIVGGVTTALGQLAVAEYKKLIGGKKIEEAKTRKPWLELQNERIESCYEKMCSKYGFINVKDTKSNSEKGVIAYDDWGKICYDALMLSIPVSKPINMTINVGTKDETISSDHLVWYDTTAMINISSEKSLLVNRVVGRDYSRKELVSNGDINFSVSGNIVSNIPDVYPSAEVQKFRQIMQYKGIIDVNNEILDQWGISRIVIKSFSLPPKEGSKSVQEYSFDAVGLQPDYEANVTEDTVKIIDNIIAEETEKNDKLSWSKLLSDKLNSLKENSVSAVSDSLTLAEGYLGNSIGIN